jgi:hypothetical protein
MGGSVTGDGVKKPREWRITTILSMWFQDLWTYDFRRTEMCVIPYATQEGEISFCAYNTGVGWRQIVEKMFSTHSTAQWFKEKGRHPIYAAGKSVPLDGNERPIPASAIALPVREDVPALASAAATAARTTSGAAVHAGH